MQSCATDGGQETGSFPTSGAALVERARLGDVEAFDELYRTHRDRVYTLCVDLCGDRELAEDLLQETFVKIWRGLRGFGGRSSFTTWVHRIAVNVCRDADRRRRRYGDDAPVGRHGMQAEACGTRPSAALDQELVGRVRVTLGQLRPPHRAVLVLRYTLCLSYEEIAETLNWSLARVKVTIHRAKRAFKEAYAEGIEQ